MNLYKYVQYEMIPCSGFIEVLGVVADTDAGRIVLA